VAVEEEVMLVLGEDASALGEKAPLPLSLVTFLSAHKLKILYGISGVYQAKSAIGR
jgi:hypothetical protein